MEKIIISINTWKSPTDESIIFYFFFLAKKLRVYGNSWRATRRMNVSKK